MAVYSVFEYKISYLNESDHAWGEEILWVRYPLDDFEKDNGEDLLYQVESFIEAEIEEEDDVQYCVELVGAAENQRKWHISYA